MFIGKFDNSIDDKGRIIIPVKFREELGSKCVIAKDVDACLTICTENTWEAFIREKVAVLPEGDPMARKLKKYYGSAAHSGDVDKQGRVKIPKELLDYAQISRDVITYGFDNKIQVWSKEAWEMDQDVESGEVISPSELAEYMLKYGF